jgi:N-acetyl-anhydromuramyl-L-alanine amidase AmpD
MYLTWLADALRARGLKVVEQPGWHTRGREWAAEPKGILCHHTAGAMHGNAPSLNLVQDGRPDLAGPLSQFVLGRDGTWYVVAAGRSNHAGAGIWEGITAGNSQMLGIEAENAGTGKDPWPAIQLNSYAHGVAALLERLGQSPRMVAGHKEYARPLGRKIDPTFDMFEFRTAVASAMSGNRVTGIRVPDSNPAHAMLQRGATGESVDVLQIRLADHGHRVTVDGVFGAATEKAVKAFQSEHGLTVDGLVGPSTWAALDRAAGA